MSRYRQWTADEIARLRELRAAGRTADEIAVDLGRSAHAVQNQCRVHGLPAPLRRGRTWTAREVARLRELWGQGVPLSDIAAELGRSLGAIQATVATYRRDLPRRVRFTAVQREAAVQRVRRGALIADVVRDLGCSRPLLAKWLRAAGVGPIRPGSPQFVRRQRMAARRRENTAPLRWATDRDRCRAEGWPPGVTSHAVKYLAAVGALGETTALAVARWAGVYVRPVGGRRTTETAAETSGRLAEYHRRGWLNRRRAADNRTWLYSLSEYARECRAKVKEG